MHSRAVFRQTVRKKYSLAVSTLCQADPNEVSKSYKVPFQDTTKSGIAAFCSPQLLHRFYSDPVSFFIKVRSGKSRVLALAALDQVVLQIPGYEQEI